MADGGAHAGDGAGEGEQGSLEWLTPVASAFGGGGWRVDRVRGVTPQPVAGLPLATGARGGGGGSPEWSQWHCALHSALEALFYSTNYVYVRASGRGV